MKPTVMKDDRQLLRKLKKRDPNALNDTFKQYRVWLLMVAAATIPDVDVSDKAHIAKAKKMVEDFFIECWEQQLFKHVDVPLRTFLFRAFTERCRKQHALHPVIP
ncbi:hypothetical protein [uncultured Chitinophaga sp.]|jgi:hypothetical protein|uniref:hypothetical protein n=1 Tax=uncultured Chitinophaga sp. TaxID=339340 RepID=UPI002633C3F1|nr:hypothetical protein [uncultured Chitinophaga sp.]